MERCKEIGKKMNKGEKDVRKEKRKHKNAKQRKENESRGGEMEADKGSISHSDSHLPCQLLDASVTEGRTLHICCSCHICSTSYRVCVSVGVNQCVSVLISVSVNQSVFVVMKQSRNFEADTHRFHQLSQHLQSSD